MSLSAVQVFQLLVLYLLKTIRSIIILTCKYYQQIHLVDMFVLSFKSDNTKAQKQKFP